MPKKITPPPAVQPTSMRFTEEDKKALDLARKKIARDARLPLTVNLTPTDIVRVALSEFVRTSNDLPPFGQALCAAMDRPRVGRRRASSYLVGDRFGDCFFGCYCVPDWR